MVQHRTPPVKIRRDDDEIQAEDDESRLVDHMRDPSVGCLQEQNRDDEIQVEEDVHGSGSIPNVWPEEMSLSAKPQVRPSPT